MEDNFQEQEQQYMPDPHDGLVNFMQSKYYKDKKPSEVRAAIMSNPQNFEKALSLIHQSSYSDIKYDDFKSSYLTKAGDPFKKKVPTVSDALSQDAKQPTQPTATTPNSFLQAHPEIAQAVSDKPKAIVQEGDVEKYKKLEETAKLATGQENLQKSQQFLKMHPQLGGIPYSNEISKEQQDFVFNEFPNLDTNYQNDIATHLDDLSRQDPQAYKQILSRTKGVNGSMSEKEKAGFVQKVMIDKLQKQRADLDILEARAKTGNGKVDIDYANQLTNTYNQTYNDVKNVIKQFPEQYERLKQVKAQNEAVTIKEGDSLATKAYKMTVATLGAVNNAAIDASTSFLKGVNAVADQLSGETESRGLADKGIDALTEWLDTGYIGQSTKYDGTEDLQGKQELNKETFLPQIAGQLTNMAAMFYGGGGSATKLAIAGAATSYGGYYNTALEATGDKSTAQRYALGMAAVQGMLENVSPNFGVIDFEKKTFKEGIKFLAENPKATIGGFVKHVTKGLPAELTQEFTQMAAEKVGNQLTNAAIGKDAFDTKISPEEAAETALMTTSVVLLAGALGKGHYDQEHKNMIQQLQDADPSVVAENINSLISAGKITAKQGETLNELSVKTKDETVAAKAMGVKLEDETKTQDTQQESKPAAAQTKTETKAIDESKKVKEISEDELIGQAEVKEPTPDKETKVETVKEIANEKTNNTTQQSNTVEQPNQTPVSGDATIAETNPTINDRQANGVDNGSVDSPTLTAKEQRAADGIINNTKDAALFDVLSDDKKKNVQAVVSETMKAEKVDTPKSEVVDTPVVKKEKKVAKNTTKGVFGNTKAIESFEPQNTEEEIMQKLALGQKLSESEFNHLQGSDKQAWRQSQIADDQAQNENKLDFQFSDKAANEARNAFENVTSRFKDRSDIAREIKRLQEERTGKSDISEKDIERAEALEQYNEEKAKRDNVDERAIDAEAYQAHAQYVANIDDLEVQAQADEAVAKKHGELYDKISNDPQYKNEDGSFNYEKLADNIQNGFEPDILELGIFEDANKLAPKNETSKQQAERIAKSIRPTEGGSSSASVEAKGDGGTERATGGNGSGQDGGQSGKGEFGLEDLNSLTKGNDEISKIANEYGGVNKIPNDKKTALREQFRYVYELEKRWDSFKRKLKLSFSKDNDIVIDGNLYGKASADYSNNGNLKNSIGYVIYNNNGDKVGYHKGKKDEIKDTIARLLVESKLTKSEITYDEKSKEFTANNFSSRNLNIVKSQVPQVPTPSVSEPINTLSPLQAKLQKEVDILDKQIAQASKTENGKDKVKILEKKKAEIQRRIELSKTAEQGTVKADSPTEVEDTKLEDVLTDKKGFEFDQKELLDLEIEQARRELGQANNDILFGANPINPRQIAALTKLGYLQFKKFMYETGKRMSLSDMANFFNVPISQRLRNIYDNVLNIFNSENSPEFRDKLGFVQDFRRKLQDRNVAVKMLYEDMKLAGLEITDNINFADMQELTVSKIANAQSEAKEWFRGKDGGELKGVQKSKDESWVGRVKKEVGSYEEQRDFMYAQHALDFNARAREIFDKRRDEEVKALEEEINTLTEQYVDNPTKPLKEKITKLTQEKTDLLNEPYPVQPSGMSDIEAQDIINKAQQDPDKYNQMTELAKEFRQETIIKRINLMEESGLINAETAENMRTGKRDGYTTEMPNYLPFKVKSENFEDKAPVTQGALGTKIFGIQVTDKYGKAQRYDPIVMAMTELQATQQAAENNKALLALYGAVKESPFGENIKIVNTRGTYAADEQGELKETRPDGKIMVHDLLAQHGIPFRADGKIKYIFFNPIKADNGSMVQHPVVKALKANPSEQGAFANALLNGYRTIVNYLRLIRTSYNLGFAIDNPFRDLGEALTNISNVGEKGDTEKIRLGILKNMPKSFAYFFNPMKGNETILKEMADNFQEMKENGVMMSWRNYEGVDTVVTNLEEDIKRIEENKGRTTKEKAQVFFKALAIISESTENMTRLAVYTSMKQNGYSPQKAAYVAKNITLNFEKKGEWSKFTNLIWMFSNAAIQGSSRMVSAAKSKNFWRFGLAMTAFAAANRALLINNMDDDDEDKWIYNNLENKGRTMFYNPFDPKNPIRLPKPYSAMRIFLNLGESITDVAHGKRTASDAAFNNISETMTGALDPIGGAGGSMTNYVPTEILKQYVQVQTNEDWSGSPILKSEGYMDKQKVEQYMRSNPNTKPIFDKLALNIYDKTGANIQPTTLEYIWKNYGENAVKSIADYGKIGEAIYDVSTGKEVNKSEIPVLKRFYHEADEKKGQVVYGILDLVKKPEEITPEQLRYINTQLPILKKNASINPYIVKMIQDGLTEAKDKAIKTKRDSEQRKTFESNIEAKEKGEKTQKLKK